MTEFGNPYYLGGVSFKHNVAQFSPSGGRFVIVVKKGNIAKNTNDYSILSFRSEEALRSPSPQVVASFSSTSERPGIQDLTWVDDETIAFLGEGPGELQQLYTVDCETKRVLRLTNHATNVVSYAIAKNKERIFFTAQAPKEKLFGDMAAREGFTVSNEMLADLILGESRYRSEFYQVLFSMRSGTTQEELIPTAGIMSHQAICQQPICLSPDGRYLIFKTTTGNIPKNWNAYEDDVLQKEIHAIGREGTPHLVYHYEIMDTTTAKSEFLLECPLSKGNTEVAWSPNSDAVVVTGSYLPLDVADSKERDLRKSHSYVAEIEIPSRRITPVTPRELKLLK